MILFDIFNNSASTNGTWTYTGVISPYPAPPATYNGDVDFAGYANGTYEYTYTVTCPPGVDDTSTVTVNVGVQDSLINDLCVGAPTVSLELASSPSVSFANINTAGSGCPGLAPATLDPAPVDDGLSLTYTSDTWYKVQVTADSTPVTWSVEVTSAAYGTDIAMKNPHIVVYKGSCGSLVYQGAASPSTNYTAIFTFVPVQDVILNYYVRVLTEAGNEGIYTINFNLT